jgi:hypothetical protein
MEWSFAFIRDLAVTASAVAGALTFIIKVRDDTRARDKNAVLDWQQSVIHLIFQKSTNKWLSFEQIKQSYRSESMAFAEGKLTPKHLSDDGLRLILIKMVSARVIDQRGGDEYSLLTLDKPIEPEPPFMTAFQNYVESITGAHPGQLDVFSSVTQALQARMNDTFAIEDAVISAVGDEPGRYAIADLVLKVSRDLAASDDHVRSTIHQHLSKGTFREDDRGKLHRA